MAARRRKIEINMASSSNVHHIPYIVLGSRGYLIDESSFKRQRHNKDDMISDLPDNILYHILSFLPTKDAVKTSILATNWRYLWTYLSVLDFKMLSTQEYLQLRSNSPNYYSLLPNYPYLQKLPLPRNFNSLTKLSLQLAKTSLCIPTDIPFPSLKTLNLSHATFANDNSLEQFLSRCPLLQDLTLNYCYLFYINKITIAISTLRNLTIHIDRYCVNGHDFANYSVEIDAVNLLSLTCTSHPTIQFRIVNPPTSIHDAYIAFGRNTPQEIDHRCVSSSSLQLLSKLGNVKSLTLSKSVLVHGRRLVIDHLHLLPEFHNLTHLCLDSKTDIFSRKTIMEFLLRCPKLEVLALSLGGSTIFVDIYDHALIPVPLCFKSSLKILHISNFDGSATSFVKFLLQNARLLEEIQIHCSSFLPFTSYNMADFKNELVGMGSCVIKFQDKF